MLLLTTENKLNKLNKFLKKKSIKFKPYNKRLSLKTFTARSKHFNLRYRTKIKPFVRRNKLKRKSFLVKIQKVRKVRRFWLQPRLTRFKKSCSVFNKKTFRVFNRRRTRRVRRSFISTIRSTPNIKNRTKSIRGVLSTAALSFFRIQVLRHFKISLKTAPSVMFTKQLFSISKYKKLLLSNNLYKIKKSNITHLIKFHLNPYTRGFILKKNIRSKKSFGGFKPVQINRLNIKYRVGSHHYSRPGHSWIRRSDFFKINESVNQLPVANLLHLILFNVNGDYSSNNFGTTNQHVFSKLHYLVLEFSNLCSLYSSPASIIVPLKQHIWHGRAVSLNTFKNKNTSNDLWVRGVNSHHRRFISASIKGYKNNTVSESFLKSKKHRLTNSLWGSSIYRYLKRCDTKNINCGGEALYLYNRISINSNNEYLRKHLNLFLIGLQITGHRDSSKFKNLLGEYKKPSIFSYRTTLKNYIFTHTMIAQRSSPHFFWNGTCLSRSLGFRNGFLSNSFLLNVNENFWENTLYVKPKPDSDAESGYTASTDTVLRKLITRSTWCGVSRKSSKSFFKSLSRVSFRLKRFPSRRSRLRRFKVNNLVNKLPTRRSPIFSNFRNAKIFNNKRVSVKIKNFLVKKKFYKKSRKFLLLKRGLGVRRVRFRRILRRIKPLYYLKLKFAKRLLNTKLSEAKKNLISELHSVTRDRKIAEKKIRKYAINAKNVAKTVVTGVFDKFTKWEALQEAKILKLKTRNRLLSKIIRKRVLIKRHLNKLKPGRWSSSVNTLSAIVNTYTLKRRRRGRRSTRLKKRKLKNKLFTQRKKLKTLLIKAENIGNFKSFQSIGADSSPHNWESTMQSVNRNFISDSIRLNAASWNTTDLKFFEQALTKGVFMDTNTLNFNFEQLLFNLFFLNTLIRNKVMLKYVLYKANTQTHKDCYGITIPAIKPILHNLEIFYFGSRWDAVKNSNLFPLPNFNYSIQRRLISLFTFRRFSTYTSFWYLNMLVRFVEFCTGRKVYIKLNPFIEKSLLLIDQVQCRMWETRVAGFQRILGPKLFLKESLRILMIALKYKDPTFLINWIKSMLYRMSFWKYRSLFRYIKFVLKNLFEPNFQTLGLRGFKVKLKGKISVAGNARTRTLMLKVGRTSYSKFNNKIAHSFTLINSFTGVMGFNLWIFF